jgi:hypothetical protein
VTVPANTSVLSIGCAAPTPPGPRLAPRPSRRRTWPPGTPPR